MRRLRIVLDTNVLVSALMGSGGPPDEVVQLVLRHEALLLIDARIIAEYDEVAARPKFSFTKATRFEVLDAIIAIAEPVIASPLRLSLPNPDDRLFIEVAFAGAADYIITGNVKHFAPLPVSLNVQVRTPRQLMDDLRRV